MAIMRPSLQQIQIQYRNNSRVLLHECFAQLLLQSIFFMELKWKASNPRFLLLCLVKQKEPGQVEWQQRSQCYWQKCCYDPKPKGSVGTVIPQDLGDASACWPGRAVGCQQLWWRHFKPWEHELVDCSKSPWVFALLKNAQSISLSTADFTCIYLIQLNSTDSLHFSLLNPRLHCSG